MIRSLFALSAAAIVGLAGCASNNSAPPAEPKPAAGTAATAKRSPNHGHAPGQHGGVIIDIGADNYHAEPVFEKTKSAAPRTAPVATGSAA